MCTQLLLYWSQTSLFLRAKRLHFTRNIFLTKNGQETTFTGPHLHTTICFKQKSLTFATFKDIMLRTFSLIQGSRASSEKLKIVKLVARMVRQKYQMLRELWVECLRLGLGYY